MKRFVMILILFILFDVKIYSLTSEYKYRKLKHVKMFYKPITERIIKISVKHKIPPAAVLGMIGLESGYGSGYIAQITGNILSLTAGKSEKKLPPLYLPVCLKNNKVIYDSLEFKNYKKNDLKWKQLPPSYKKDYRPLKMAGTTHNLNFFKYHKKKYYDAMIKNVEDFMKFWIKKQSKIKAFSQARIYLDKKVEKEGVETLFNLQTNIEFIDIIGGKPISFNYRKSWPKKVKLIIKNAKLNELSRDIHFGKQKFTEAWDNFKLKINIPNK